MDKQTLKSFRHLWVQEPADKYCTAKLSHFSSDDLTFYQCLQENIWAVYKKVVTTSKQIFIAFISASRLKKAYTKDIAGFVTLEDFWIYLCVWYQASCK